MMNSLDALFTDKKIIEAPKGKIIVYEGHSIKKIYRVLNGYVKVYTIAGANKQRILFIYKPGDVFPITTFLSGDSAARFFYEAMTPATLQCITPKQMEGKLLNNLRLGEAIISYTNLLDRQFLSRVNNMVSDKDPLSKVKTLLFFFCERAGSTESMVKINLPLTSRVIASMCGISVKEASVQFDYLKSKGIVTAGSGLTINKQKLQALKTS
jgi:CRP-like cAMP-binding protein